MNPRQVTRQQWVLAFAVVVCGAIRWGYISSFLGGFNADEATTGLMVRRIQDGHFYPFYAGQHYGGSLEQYLQTAWFSAFGLPMTEFTLKLPLVGVAMATSIVIHRAGLRLRMTNSAAVAAVVIFAVWPWFNIQGSTDSLGFYSLGQFLTVASLVAGLRVGENASPQRLALAGFVIGLSLWTALTTLFVIIPVLIYLLPAIRRGIAGAVSLVMGAALGGLPVVYLILVDHQLPLPGRAVISSTLGHRIAGIWHYVLPEFLGLRFNNGAGGLPRRLATLILVLLCVGYCVAVWRYRRDIVALLSSVLRSPAHQPRPLTVLILVPLVVCLTYPLSEQAFFTSNPRYLFTSYPLLALGIAAALPLTRRVSRLGLLCVLAGMAATTSAFFLTVRDHSTTGTPRKFYAAAGALLTSRGEPLVWADYWIAMPLDFYNEGTIDAAAATGAQRFPDIQNRVATAPSNAWVTSTRDASDRRLQHALAASHLRFRETAVGTLRVYDDFSADASPTSIGLFG